MPPLVSVIAQAFVVIVLILLLAICLSHYHKWDFSFEVFPLEPRQSIQKNVGL